MLNRNENKDNDSVPTHSQLKLMNLCGTNHFRQTQKQWFDCFGNKYRHFLEDEINNWNVSKNQDVNKSHDNQSCPIDEKLEALFWYDCFQYNR